MKVSAVSISLLAAGLALPLAARAQNELSNFSATGRGGVVNTFAQDYQAIGVNPANLGRPGEAVVALTVGEAGAGLASRSLSKTLLKHIIFDGNQPIGPAEKAQLVAGFEGENALNINFDATTLGVSITLPSGLGGVAFSNRVRLNTHVALNHNAADVLVNGQYAASLQPYYPSGGGAGTLPPPLVSNFLDGTSIQLAFTSEYNIAYGVRVIDQPMFKASVGAGYRYIQGLGVADVRASSGNLSAYSALSPLFSIDYGALASSPQFNAKTGSALQPVGHGNGYDGGLAFEIGKVVRVGASVTELGTMTWTGNVVTASDQKLQATSSTGIQSYDVFKELVDQFNTDQTNLFSYQAAQERTADLPAKLRLGVGVRISSIFEAGIDYTAPLNKVAGNLTAPFIGLGFDAKPLGWLRVSSGVSGGAGYGASLPLGLTFVSSVWDIGVSSRDVLGYISEKNPYYSAAFGFLRFKIGGEK
ncbi:hypothetical protein GCM10022409_13050 [Hymenobacter glaciei]|uniref:DUF5723 domain-containing protein n=1 Tax=Hymenobacter glaciei TaxID=877209 RepID=A0ABP7TRW4_9BACT